MTSRNSTDGKPLTPAGQRVKVLDRGSYLGHGTVGIVTDYCHKSHSSNGRISVRNLNSEGSDSGYWITAWEELEEVKPEVKPLSDKQAQDLTDRALESAKKRGYCNETKNILSDLGLPTEATKYVTLQVREEDFDGNVEKVKVNGTKVKFKVVS